MRKQSAIAKARKESRGFPSPVKGDGQRERNERPGESFPRVDANNSSRGSFPILLAPRSRPERAVTSGDAPVLERIERWVQEVITHPNGVRAGLESAEAAELIDVTPESLDSVVRPSQQLSSIERMEIYSSSYFLRLVECLEQDYEVTSKTLGQDRFTELARVYITAHPSTHNSLNVFGAHFPEFLRCEAGDFQNRDFVATLATLEWKIQEAFDERQAEPLTVDQLLDVPAKRWGQARLRLIPAFRLLLADYPVNTYLQAIYDEKPARIPKPRRSWTAIYRCNNRVWRANLDRERFALLSEILAGKPLVEALEICAAAPGIDPGRFAALARAWFKDWTADGIFCAVEF